MSELETPDDGRHPPSPQLLHDTLKRMIRRVADQVAADLLAERGTDAHSERSPSASAITRDLKTLT